MEAILGQVNQVIVLLTPILTILIEANQVTILKIIKTKMTKQMTEKKNKMTMTKKKKIEKLEEKQKKNVHSQMKMEIKLK
jgi:hypothetical protein